MNCKDVQRLVHAYLDGELDLAGSLDVEQHMQACPACTAEYSSQQVLHEATAGALAYYRAPAALRASVRSSVRHEARLSASPPASRYWLGLAGALVLIALVAWGVIRYTSTATAQNQLAEQVASSHVRSLLGDHLADVPSSDEHTVKPWFAGKLDFSPVVGDWPGQGYTLVGGRLDYLDNRTVAALIYRHNQHVINLFTWPSSGPDTPVSATIRQGYNLMYWTQAGMTYWAVSDLNAAELKDFVALARQQGSPAATP